MLQTSLSVRQVVGERDELGRGRSGIVTKQAQLSYSKKIGRSLPLGLALGSQFFPSGCEGKLGVALERAEGLLFLHGLESNPGSSLQTEEEAGLP